MLDLQVNGYAGVDFNQDALSAGQLHLACERLAADGASGFLATFVTAGAEEMAARIANLVRLRERDPLAARMIVGLHLEGPFINPAEGFRGAHEAASIRPADPDLACRLLDAGGGLVRLVTLAPECDQGLRTTRRLAGAGVRVAAGHTDASRDELAAAADAGLTIFTHLGNGCPALLPRHDNIIQRALSLRERLWISFIADGAHIPFWVLSNYLAATGTERCLVVSDAVAPAGLGPGRYRLGRLEIDIGPDCVARLAGTPYLAGSCVTMKQSAENLRMCCGLAEAEVEQLTRTNPRRAIGLPG